MATYKSQATTKYYGLGGTGKVYTNTQSDGLAKSLSNAGYVIGQAEDKRIDRKKDKAIAKIDELYASGKSFEEIQSEILANKHPDLTGKYIEATTNYHAGKVKAAEVIKEIEANKNEYDYTDTSQSLETFYEKFLPEFESMDKATILGFSKAFNVYKSQEAIKDAENRSAWASEVKISEGVSIIETLPTGMIEAELGNTIKDMQTSVPSTDGSSKPNQLYTNKETLSVLLRSVNKIIAEAETEADLERAEAILNADLGFGQDGTKLKSLGSRNHKEILKAKEDLLKKKRALIINDRQEKAEIEKEEVRALNASIFEEVEVEGTTDGEVVTRPKNHKELMEIRDELEKFGVPAYVQNFDRLIDANAYIETDPAVFDQLVADIFDGKYATQDEVADAIVALNIDPKLLSSALTMFSQANKKGKALHTSETVYKEGLKYAENAVKGNFTNQKGYLKDNGNIAIRNAHNYMVKEINAFEARFEEKNGSAPTEADREEFMQKLGDQVIKMFSTDDVNPTMKSMTEYEEEIKQEEAEKERLDKKYTDAGIPDMELTATNVLKDNNLKITQTIKDSLEAFDSNWFGFGWGNDERLGESERESRQRVADEKLPQLIADALEGVNFNENILAAYEGGDYENLLKSILEELPKSEFITTEQIDVALNDIIGKGKAKWQKE